ncbi:LOW QUALITY PROTEIN: tubulin-folding cofactor B, partial [Podargus strigoides]
QLELVVGSPASCMELELFGGAEEPLGRLDCDEALLGSYPMADGCRVHVTDRSGARMGQYQDLSRVEKYEMPDSDYEKRPGVASDTAPQSLPCPHPFSTPHPHHVCSAAVPAMCPHDVPMSLPCPHPFSTPHLPVRALRRCQPGVPTMSPRCPRRVLRSFLRQRQLGRYDTEGTQRRRAQEATLASTLPLGGRCQVRLPGQPPKRATIMYVGETDFKPGFWVGVRYDEPLGKHDGSVDGRRYFECQPKYGAFVKPQHVTAGDFPGDDGLEDEL